MLKTKKIFSKTKIIIISSLLLIISCTSLFAGEEQNQGGSTPQVDVTTVQQDTDNPQNQPQDNVEADSELGWYGGFSVNLGAAASTSSEDDRGSLNFSFFFGASFINFKKKWLISEYLLKYKRFYLNAGGSAKYYDYIALDGSLLFNIKSFLIGINAGFSTGVASNEAIESKLGLRFGLGLGYLFRLGNNVLMPITIDGDFQYADASPNYKGIIFGIYLNVRILFKI